MKRIPKRGHSTPNEKSLSSKKGQMNLVEPMLSTTMFSQEKAKEVWIRWFITSMMPLSLTEHPETRLMMDYFRPEFDVPSMLSLGRDIDRWFEQGKQDLANILSTKRTVATTADCYTSHSRYYVGMTVHWIDGESLQREQATLACKELKDGQVHLLGQTMLDILQEFGLLGGKVAATTTDHGANYDEAFSSFGVTAVDGQQDSVFFLPPQQHCSVRTLNLMASVDIASVPGWNADEGSAWRTTADKALDLWNLHNRGAGAANQIKAAIKRKLKTPVANR